MPRPSIDEFNRMAADPAEFRKRLLIDCDGVVKPLASVCDPWQAADFAAIDPGLMRAAGVPTVTEGKQRMFLQRPRGHSKSSDLAVVLVWALLFAKRPLKAIVAAADRDQSLLLRSAVVRLMMLNPWIGNALTAQASKVTNGRTGSEAEFISSDVSSSFGHLADIFICDELTCWENVGLWESLLSAAAKKRSALLVIAANAGFEGDWQARLRDAIDGDPSWYYRSLPGCVASWIGERQLAEQKRLLSESAYRRLWLNCWVSAVGDVLDAADLEAAIDASAKPMRGDEPQYAFVAGLDLGIRRDHSALCVLGHNLKTKRIHLAYSESWAPPPGGQVDLMAVQGRVYDVARRFRCPTFFDPWQAELLAEQLRRRGLKMLDRAFSGSNLNAMAVAVLEVFRERRLSLYPDAALMRDLGKLRIVERSFGYKLEAARDEYGHCDRAMAFAIALPGIIDTAIVRSGIPWGGQSCVHNLNRWSGYKAPPGEASMYGEPARRSPF